MIYNLNIQEAYLIFKGLKYIYNCNRINEELFRTTIRIKNDLNITKNELKDILDREFIIDNNRYKWLENISIESQNIYITFNIEIFNYFDNNFIDFVKKLSFDFKHICTLKFQELFNNKTKTFLTLNDLKTLDNNSFIYEYNIKKELEKINQNNIGPYERNNLNILNNFKTLIEENKSFDFYLKYLNIIKNDFKFLYNRTINFKLAKLIINGKVEYGFLIKEQFDKKKLFTNNDYINELKNIFINDKNKVFNYRSIIDL